MKSVTMEEVRIKNNQNLRDVIYGWPLKHKRRFLQCDIFIWQKHKAALYVTEWVKSLWHSFRSLLFLRGKMLKQKRLVALWKRCCTCSSSFKTYKIVVSTRRQREERFKLVHKAYFYVLLSAKTTKCILKGKCERGQEFYCYANT